jgi:hypothetical protein
MWSMKYNRTLPKKSIAVERCQSMLKGTTSQQPGVEMSNNQNFVRGGGGVLVVIIVFQCLGYLIINVS